MLGEPSLLHGYHHPVSCEVCSSVFGAEVPEVGFSKALLSLSACSVPKEVTAEAGEARVVTTNLSTTCVGFCGSAQK